MKFSIATLVVVLVALTHDSANAFVSPRPSSLGGYGTTSAAVRQPFLSAPVQQTTTTSSTQLNSAVSNLVDGKQLTTFFLETLISSGVPALFTIAVIAFAANAFRPKKEERQQQFGGNNNPVTELYNDLYGDPAAKQKSPFSFLSGGRQQQVLAQNTGVPAQQYIKIENRNSRLDNYQYSMNAATQSKAAAAAEARSKNFDKALVKGIGSTARTLTAFQKSKLLEAERDFLKRGSQVQSQIAALETQLTETAIDSELKAIGMSPTEMDPEVSNDTADENVTNVVIADKEAMFQLGPSKRSKLVKEVTALQESLLQLELSFIQNVIGILGPDRANGVKAALVGDVATRGAGGFLSQLQNRPLTVLLNSDGEERRKSVFVTQFPGDPTASQVSDLREEVTAIVRNSKPGDEALVVLQTGGGTVTGYGLAAAQLQRFKEHGMKLTVCVEQVAASGGYMMCCVGDRIVASPFAVLGSIGVISDIPNVYQRLKDEGIEFQTITAGKYKRTITPTKKVTQEDMRKSKEDIEEVLKLFKTFVKENRPSLDIEKVATGETWFGTDALELNLCDEIKTVDEVISEYIDADYNVYDVKYDPPPEKPEFMSLIPVGVDESGGIISRAARWLARTVAAEFKAELNNVDYSSSQRPDRKYMMKDDSSERIRAE